ncbi:MAG: carboxypeptidase-like regulatory domain-containing protein [Vicingaceae bacterium]|nr:carboxypeptidase-like regulatory domain-containing protein [Vicingaceae bacterium]
MKSINTYFYFVLLSFLVTLTYSCKKDSIKNPEKPVGVISGKVVAQNSTTPISNATVFVDVLGEVSLTHTNTKGEFKLLAPEGKQTLHIQTGGGRIFRTEIEIDVVANQERNISSTNSAVILSQVSDLAYIPGVYDAIEDIIIDSLGYTATQLSVSDLDNPSTLQQYAAIFLNCGKSGNMDSLKYYNLNNYILAGGSIYASDWAVNYLSGDGNFKITPTNFNELHDHKNTHGHLKTCSTPLGGIFPDNELCTQKTGASTTINNSNIVAQDIQNALGKNAINIYYNLGSWEVIENWDQWEVLINDNNTYGPLAIRRNIIGTNPPSQGGNNSNNNKVTICHIPPGNPSNPQTITISINALQAHLNHGCFIGTCAGQGGNIYYTTFHNKPQGGISQDVQNILNYFILNL